MGVLTVGVEYGLQYTLPMVEALLSTTPIRDGLLVDEYSVKLLKKYAVTAPIIPLKYNN